jgi:hypothetical protein
MGGSPPATALRGPVLDIGGDAMNARPWLAMLALATLASCNAERKQECDQLLTVMKPLESGAARADPVDHAQAAVAAIQFQDQPLREYASSIRATLTTLSSTLKVQSGDSPPDGADDLVRSKFKELRGERDDVTRYCAE